MSDDEYLKSDLLSGLAAEIHQQLNKETLLISKRGMSSCLTLTVNSYNLGRIAIKYA